ncbi:MAG: glycosyltransferase [Bacteroidaceae bacterium]|nr:glycosyltransferase [Bacteroidaceae bacterium]
MKKISVITVCLNCAEKLERTIQSVIKQTYTDLEYIIVDGGSQDDTINIIKKYQLKITKWISEKDDGIYDAMNKGIKMASGEWVNFMNAGDVFVNNDVLENILCRAIPDDIDFIYSDYYYMKKSGSIELRTLCREKGEINHQSSIYKKSLHETYGYYVVTHPYIVSDLLFFLSIPKERFQKSSFIISINEAGGISDMEDWCREQALCLKVVFGIENIKPVFKMYIKKMVKQLIRYNSFKKRLKGL